jgi:hypothetical protein
VNYIFSGTIQENAKRMNFRRFQKAPELNRSGLQENTHLEVTRGPHAKAEPKAQACGPIVPSKCVFSWSSLRLSSGVFWNLIEFILIAFS